MGMQSFLAQFRNKLSSSSRFATLSITELIDSVRRQIRGDDSQQSTDLSEECSSVCGGSSCDGGSPVLSSPLHRGGSWTQEVQLLGLLGEGAFGKVYRGLWKGEPVAVKTMVLPNNVSGIEKRERMAIMEAAISTALSHPNIVQVSLHFFFHPA